MSPEAAWGWLAAQGRAKIVVERDEWAEAPMLRIYLDDKGCCHGEAVVRMAEGFGDALAEAVHRIVMGRAREARFERKEAAKKAREGNAT